MGEEPVKEGSAEAADRDYISSAALFGSGRYQLPFFGLKLRKLTFAEECVKFIVRRVISAALVGEFHTQHFGDML